ncbi:hypothetical protein QQS21_008265 [Conoideocrella luteorostrata]|uniref:Methyltransferase domain-containing protein n=1 Tax=Conoideocrella luteorostrata TaxID=1105319 RepID=A0AAJ0CLH3_9HYPO|nr:hypothetical protein QQS21_008265 [Conoideocrella luteorostrata]
MSSGDIWEKASKIYAEKAKLMTYPFARTILDEANKVLPLTDPDTHVLDVGCGSGAIANALAKAFPGVKMLAVDWSAAMLEIVNSQKLPNVETRQVNGMNLTPILASQPKGFTHVFSNFMNQFTPDPFQPIKEMIRAARSDGVIGLSSWGSFDILTMFTSAAQSVDPSWQSPGPWATKEFPETAPLIENIFRSWGLIEVTSREKVVTFDFKTINEVLDYFFESGNPAMMRLINDFKDSHSVEALERVRQVMLESIGPGKWDVTALKGRGFMTIGRKP